MLKLLKDPVWLERLDKQGIAPAISSNADFAPLQSQDYERMAKVVTAAGAQVASRCCASQASICAGSLTVLSCW